MPEDSTRARAVDATRRRLLDAALDLLGADPEAGMGDIAAAAGVVRRTVYGHFPTRTALLQELTREAVGDLTAALGEADVPGRDPEAAWAEAVTRLWPLAHRHRALVALRRSDFGEELHRLLAPFDAALTDLVRRGQDAGAFGTHLPADVLGQIAYSAVFTLAERSASDPGLDARAATVAGLVVLGVPEQRAQEVAGPASPTQTGPAGRG